MGGRLAAPTACLILASGCFSGADAAHLPCERDDDCGQGQSCVASVDPQQKFCDGPPDTFDPSTTSGTGPATDGSSSSDSSGPGTDTGPIPMCGTVVDPDYECEPGEMGPTGACTDACRFPIFGEDFEAGAPQFALAIDTALPASLDGLRRVDAGWEIDLSDRWMQISEYTPPFGELPVDGGIAVAVSDAITVPALPPGARWELRFRHRFLAEPPGSCGRRQSLLSDGGSIVVWVEGDNERAFFLLENAAGTALPLLAEGDPAQCVATYGVQPNPLEGEAAFTGQVLGRGGSQLADAAFVLPLEAGDAQIQVLFVMSYDCGNCWEPMRNLVEPGWRIDDVSVAAYREP